MALNRRELDEALREGGYTLAGLAILGLRRFRLTVRTIEQRSPAGKVASEVIERGVAAVAHEVGAHLSSILQRP